MTILRYVRLYLYLLRFSLGKALHFRIDFWFRVGMDLVYYAVNLAFYRIVYLHTDLLGGWTEAQALVFVGCYLVVDALHMTVFANNLWWLPVLVNKGDLDYYLIRPVSPLFFLSVRDFAVNSFVNLVMAIGILTWAISGLPGPLDWAGVLLLGPTLCLGAFLYYLVHLLTIIPVFWLHSGRGLESVFYNLGRFMERPDRIFTGWTRRLLVSILPFSVMASFPARLFLERFSPWVLLHLLAVIAGFWVLVLWVWNRGLRAYSSASS